MPERKYFLVREVDYADDRNGDPIIIIRSLSLSFANVTEVLCSGHTIYNILGMEDPECIERLWSDREYRLELITDAQATSYVEMDLLKVVTEP